MGCFWTPRNQISSRKTSESVSQFQFGHCTHGDKVATLTNPLETPLSYILVFGDFLLALTEGGDRMLIWNTVDGGASYSCAMI